MNREIKFRAWDGRKMFNVDVLAISEVQWDSSGTGVSLAYQPSMKVMQYTGLKDKNGTEIYEGDIGDWHGRKFKVMFEYGCFVMRSIDEEDYVNGFHENCEIIGNVFEHSHLLEESK